MVLTNIDQVQTIYFRPKKSIGQHFLPILFGPYKVLNIWSATSASTSSPAAPIQPSLPNVEVAQFSSTLYGECSESVVLNGSTTCGYSELGSSASACGRSFEEVAEQLHRVQGSTKSSINLSHLNKLCLSIKQG